MPDGSYNDRALGEPVEGALPKPQIEIIVDGASVFKPGMKTYFVDDYEDPEDIQAKVVGVQCTCNTVTSSHYICTCESVAVCTCESFNPTCTCLGQGSSLGGGTVCTCQAVSCGSPCACIPVYL